MLAHSFWSWTHLDNSMNEPPRVGTCLSTRHFSLSICVMTKPLFGHFHLIQLDKFLRVTGCWHVGLGRNAEHQSDEWKLFGLMFSVFTSCVLPCFCTTMLWMIVFATYPSFTVWTLEKLLQVFSEYFCKSKSIVGQAKYQNHLHRRMFHRSNTTMSKMCDEPYKTVSRRWCWHIDRALGNLPPPSTQ